MLRRQLIGAAFTVALVVSGLVSTATPGGATDLTPVVPARLFDSRPGAGTVDGQGLPASPVGPGQAVTIAARGRADIPADAGAVILTLTTTNVSTWTYLTVWDGATARPYASQAVPTAGTTQATTAITQLASDGTFAVYNAAGTTDLVIDVVSWLPTTSPDIVSIAPARLLDTRPGAITVDGQGSPATPVAEAQTMTIPAAGRGGVPAGATAMLATVTVLDASASGFVTLWDGILPRPGASTANPTPGTVATTMAVIGLNPSGNFAVYNGLGTVDVIVDVFGYLPLTPGLVPVAPARLLDTRPGAWTIDGQGLPGAPVGPTGAVAVQATGRGGVPPVAGTVMVTLTSTAATEPTYLTAWNGVGAHPYASVANPTPGQTSATTIVVELDEQGAFSVFNQAGSTDVIVDVVAWSMPPGPQYDDLDSSGLPVVGPASAGDGPFTVVLGLTSDQAGLTAFAQAVSDPTSPIYGQYLTLDQAIATYGASGSTGAAVASYFGGLSVTPTFDPTGTTATVELTLAQLSTVFGTTFSNYQVSQVGCQFAQMFPDQAPTLPAGLSGAVDRVHGLAPLTDNIGPCAALDITSAGLATSTAAAVNGDPTLSAQTIATQTAFGGTTTRTGDVEAGPATGLSSPTAPCPDAVAVEADGTPMGLMPNQMLDAYGLDTLHKGGITGAGIRLAVVNTAPAIDSDLATFRACFGLQGSTEPNVIPVPTGGPLPAPDDEPTLDLSILAFAAPDLAHLDQYVVTPDPDDNGVTMLRLVQAPLDTSQTAHVGQAPHVVSISYGACESLTLGGLGGAWPLVDMIDQTLAIGAAAGITYVASAGDSGSLACSRLVDAFPYPADVLTPTPAMPSTQTWITSVGGTNITLDADNEIASSGVWNDMAWPTPMNTAAGGGGQSAMVPRPWYQQGGAFPVGGGRLTPDISAFSDPLPGYVIYCTVPGTRACNGAGWQNVAGTSAAASLVASGLALVDQSRLNESLPALGFANPLLYSVAQGPSGPIVDVTLGTNDLEVNRGLYTAGAGYDLASGWGWPSFEILTSTVADPCARYYATVAEPVTAAC